MKTVNLTVTKLYGRCLTFHIGPASIEVKVMGDAATAGPARELLLIALEEAGVKLVEPAKAAMAKAEATVKAVSK